MLPAPERYFDFIFSMQVQSTHSLRSRKRSASLQSHAASDEEKDVDSDVPVKRLKKYNPATNSFVAIT